jgi:putative endonuclease
MKTYYVYIMASASRVLYTGVTNDIVRRVLEHQQRQVPGFVARYNVQELVYFAPFGDVRAAIAREKQIKGSLRVKKIALIESLNPRWKDLGAKWRGAAHDPGIAPSAKIPHNLQP